MLIISRADKTANRNYTPKGVVVKVVAKTNAIFFITQCIVHLYFELINKKSGMRRIFD